MKAKGIFIILVLIILAAGYAFSFKNNDNSVKGVLVKKFNRSEMYEYIK